MPTTSLDLLDAVQAVIVAADTDAGPRTFRPGDWPTQVGQYPIIKLRMIAESRRSLGRGGAAQFATTTTVRIICEVSEPAQIDNAGATAAETALWSLKRQIEVAVINSYPLQGLIEQIGSIQSQLAFTSEAATHLSGLQMDVALDYYEGPESFAPIIADDLDEIDVTGDGLGAAPTFSNLGD